MSLLTKYKPHSLYEDLWGVALSDLPAQPEFPTTKDQYDQNFHTIWTELLRVFYENYPDAKMEFLLGALTPEIVDNAIQEVARMNTTRKNLGA